MQFAGRKARRGKVPGPGAGEADAYCRATYGLPYATVRTIQAIVAGPAEQVAAALARYAEAGVEHLVCRIAAPSMKAHIEQLELLAAIERPTLAQSTPR